MRFDSGVYTVDLLPACRFRMDGGGLFGAVPRVLWERAYGGVDERNRVPLVAWSLLIRGEGCVVVVDAGIGHKLGEKRDGIFAVDHGARGGLVGELDALGVSPAQVTHFLYTHLHIDHAGGATALKGDGKVRPVFPKARHFVSRPQLNWARNPSDKDKASYYPENWEPVAEAGLLEIIEGPTEFLPGIELRFLDGHTPGLICPIIRGAFRAGGCEAAGLLFATDLFPTAAHLNPAWIAAYDNNPLVTLNEKKAFASEFANKHIFLFGHDARLPAGFCHSDKGAQRVESLAAG